LLFPFRATGFLPMFPRPYESRSDSSRRELRLVCLTRSQTR
jgi:hypothetical protein